MGSRRKARECALQMLFAADVAETRPDELARTFWSELSDDEMDEQAREFATRLAVGTLAHMEEVDARIRSRAEHWRIDRMATVDRNSCGSQFTNFSTKQHRAPWLSTKPGSRPPVFDF